MQLQQREPCTMDNMWIDKTRPDTLDMPKPEFSDKPGVGSEIEIFILDDEGRPMNQLGGVNTARKIITTARERYKSDAPFIWCEEAAFHMEAISGVNNSIRDAVAEAMKRVDLMDSIARPFGGNAVLVPIPRDRFVFSLSPNPRAATLLDDPSWAANAAYTTIASTQINDSRLYADCTTDVERWARTLYLLNSFTPEDVANMREHDSLARNWEVRTRLQVLRSLIPGEEKWAAFADHGFTDQNHVLYPPHFDSEEHMMSWILAHGKRRPGASIEGMDNGMVHAGLMKPKWGDVWMGEYRIMGSMGSTTDEVMTHLSPVIAHSERVMGELGL